MIRAGRTLGAVLIVSVGLALAAVTLRAREHRYELTPVAERLLYVRSGPSVARLSLTFDALVSDVYWIRTIQHYGRDYKNRTRACRFELLQSLLDLTTTLDSHFLIAYRFGAIFLALSPPDGPGRPDQAIALLEKGLAANPNRWQLAHDLGFTHYLHTGDYRAAAEWFQRAAAMPGAPLWISQLAATTMATGGNRQGARQLLRELQSAQEDYIRRSAERTLAQVDALDLIDYVNAQIAVFRTRTGREPGGWQDLIAAGLLPGAPLDPARVPLVFDPATRSVTLAPTSPLLPLPPMLLGK